MGGSNPHAAIVVLLDNPGAREDREGNAYVCGTRETLQRAAHEVGLAPEELYVTYILKCRPRKAYDKPLARETCRVHLQFQLLVMRPRFLFCLGNVALQSFLRDPDAEVKRMRGEWLDVGGIAVTTSYHPLAVRRRPVLYRHFVHDWKLLADRYREEKSRGGSAEPIPRSDG